MTSTIRCTQGTSPGIPEVSLIHLEWHVCLLQASLYPKGSWERLIRVATFAVSGYSASAPHRTSKPFNPLLGETYEFICPEKGFRFIGEKVNPVKTFTESRSTGLRFCSWMGQSIVHLNKNMKVAELSGCNATNMDYGSTVTGQLGCILRLVRIPADTGHALAIVQLCGMHNLA